MELDFVRWLTERSAGGERIALGIGDDAALLHPLAGRQLVVASDMLTDQVHFDLAHHAPERIGRKSLAVNLSDLAAMAAEPLAATVSLNLPRGDNAETLARLLIEGMTPLADQYDCPIVGGDTNVVDGPLVVSVTVLGSVAPNRAWQRDGAKPGDRLLVTGKLGGSLAGHHLDFTPRVAEAIQLSRNHTIHAAIDLSDGLALDLARLAAASSVGAIVEAAHLPISNAAQQLATTSNRTSIDHALGDGEDFELLLAVPPQVADDILQQQPLACSLTDVGEITTDHQLLQRTADGTLTPLPRVGYEHGS